MSTHKKDHGEFTLKTSANDDFKLLRSSVPKAKVNPKHPGHHWTRLVGKDDAGTFEIIKLYHVDLNLEVAEITETRDGKETARRTLPLHLFA